MSNIITASFTKGRICKTPSVYQYNVGMILRFKGIDLPETYRVDFSNALHGKSKAMIGSTDGVEIPYEYFVPGENIYAWIVLNFGENGVVTEYQAQIPISPRAKPTDEAPLPSQKSAIDQAISALNEAANRVPGGFSKNTVIYHGVTIQRKGNTITLNGQGDVYKYLYLDLSNGGLNIAEDGIATPGLLQLQEGHTYSVEGEFSGTVQSDPQESPGKCVKLLLGGTGLDCNEYEPRASIDLTNDMKSSLLLRVIIGAPPFYSFLEYLNYTIVFDLGDTITIE